MASGDNKALIEAPELNFTKASGIVAVVAAVGSAIVPTVQGIQGSVRPEVLQATVMLVGVGVVAFVISAAVDVLARAWVTTSDIQRQMVQDRSDAAALPVASKSIDRAAIAPAGAPFLLRVNSLSADPIPVLALRWDPEAQGTYYLVGGLGGRPLWVKDVDVTGLSFAAPSPLQPAPH